ncbi:MAG: hypothetical protein ACLQVD_19590 [Capsulimonadaceae bacterium]
MAHEKGAESGGNGAAICPEPEALDRFAQQVSGAEEATEVAAHLPHCDRCSMHVASVNMFASLAAFPQARREAGGSACLRDEEILALIDGIGTRQQREERESHIYRCLMCTGRLRELTAAKLSAATAAAELPSIPAQLADRQTLDRIRNAAERRQLSAPPPTPLLRISIFLAGFAAAAAAALIMAVIAPHPNTGNPGVMPNSGIVATNHPATPQPIQPPRPIYGASAPTSQPVVDPAVDVIKQAEKARSEHGISGELKVLENARQRLPNSLTILARIAEDYAAIGEVDRAREARAALRSAIDRQ